MSKSRFWTFTINNYTQAEAVVVQNAECVGMKAGFEIGESGTPHIQAAVYFENPLTMKGVKRRVGQRAHLEKAKGTWADQDYCLKGEQSKAEWKLDKQQGLNFGKNVDVCRVYGTGPEQGKRTDIESFREDLANGLDEVESYERYPGMMARYPRFRGGYLSALTKKRGSEYRKITCVVHWGPGGTGKSKDAMCNLDGSYKDDMFRVPSTTNLKWWDGYAGESIIVLEEFRGNTCTYNRFLELLDGHRLALEIKGGSVHACWTKVYITSNQHPDDWWHDYDSSMPEFARRLTQVKQY